MIAGLKPYAGYKDSGQKWLGQMPAHWEVRRLKFLLEEMDARSATGREQLLRVSQYTGVTERKSAEGVEAPDTRAASLVGYKQVFVGDLVINIMLAWNGSLGVSRYNGIASPAYCVYRFKEHALPWYYHELLRLPAYKGRIKVASTGVVESRLRLYSENLGCIEALLPPPDEQAAIVRFLDHALAKIDKAIRAKRKTIALLGEQKQAIIHRAVTRGLDPDAPLKDSGIPWLGQIPAHWDVWRISRFARVGNGSTPSRAKPSYWDGGRFPWLNSSQVNRGRINSADQFVTTRALEECHLPKVPANSVLVAITGQGKTRGMAAVLEMEATINQHLAFITIRQRVTSADFLQLALGAAYPALRAISDDSGSTKGALTCEDLKRFKVALPPVSEQGNLLLAVRQETQTLLAAISRLEREVDLLREYRTRLIADVVTGKLDVREAAAKLPASSSPDAIRDASVAEEPGLHPGCEDADDDELVEEAT